MKLAILLATYNSEEFLIEQIDSILNQTFSNFNLYIRDDGSTDITLQIIKDYTDKFPNIFILEDKVKNRKSLGSFMWMLENVEANYYMFSDHDDYWLTNKIELTFSKMLEAEHNNPNKPIVIHTDLEVVDHNLKSISTSFWDYSKINPSLLLSFNYLAVYNGLTGCTMMLNKKAKEISFPVSKFALMHDSWISLKVTAENGIIEYVNSPTILYRQHSKNVIGAKKAGSLSYLGSKFLKTKFVLQDNNARLKMVNNIIPFSPFKFIFYKILYNIKK